MRKKNFPIPGINFAQPGPKVSLSQLSISQIKDYSNADDSNFTELQRQLIFQIQSERESPTDNYGLESFSLRHHLKKEKAQPANQSSIPVIIANPKGETRCKDEMKRQKSLSFNKGLQRKKKSIKVVQNKIKSAGPAYKIYDSGHIPDEKNKKFVCEKDPTLQFAGVRSAKPVSIAFKTAMELKTKLIQNSFDLNLRHKDPKPSRNMYYLKPDDLKIEINDLNPSFGKDIHRSVSRSLSKSKEQFWSMSSQSYKKMSSSCSNFSTFCFEPIHIASQKSQTNSNSEKKIQTIKPQSVEVKKKVSQSIDSHSRDSSSTAANGTQNCNDSGMSKHSWEYCLNFKRSSH